MKSLGGEEKSKYGEGLIKEFSVKLSKEVDRKYDVRTLRRIRQFYIMFKNWSTVSTALTWSHYAELLVLNDVNAINYYINISINQNLSVRELRSKIKNQEYERLDTSTKNKLVKNEEVKVSDFIKNPILIKNSLNYEKISEKVLKQLILEDIENFMRELGDGFSYIDNEYKIKLGNRYNYIDLLLFNYKYNCFTVVELKITELKAEHVGQIKKYMSYVDKNVKTITQDKTIGIIICKVDNKFVMEYCSDEKIFRTTYEINPITN